MKVKEIAQKHVDQLNKMFELDPIVVGSFAKFRVIVNERLADSDVVIVGEGNTLSVLGFVNALYPLDKNNNHPIARIEEIENGQKSGSVVGFALNSNYDFDGVDK